MERYYGPDEETIEQRVERFSRFLAIVVTIDDLFPPDGGVREPRRNPENIGPRVGAVALIPLWIGESLTVPLPEQIYC